MVERRLGWEETRQARGVVVARAEVAVVMAEVALHVRMERDGSTRSSLCCRLLRKDCCWMVPQPGGRLQESTQKTDCSVPRCVLSRPAPSHSHLPLCIERCIERCGRDPARSNNDLGPVRY